MKNGGSLQHHQRNSLNMQVEMLVPLHPASYKQQDCNDGGIFYKIKAVILWKKGTAAVPKAAIDSVMQCSSRAVHLQSLDWMPRKSLKGACDDIMLELGGKIKSISGWYCSCSLLFL